MNDFFNILFGIKKYSAGGKVDDIWLSVNNDAPISYAQFYKINTSEGAEPLTPEEFDMVRGLKLGQELHIGHSLIQRVPHHEHHAHNVYKKIWDDATEYKRGLLLISADPDMGKANKKEVLQSIVVKPWAELDSQTKKLFSSVFKH